MLEGFDDDTAEFISLILGRYAMSLEDAIFGKDDEDGTSETSDAL